jgi:hypothetical protein
MKYPSDARESTNVEGHSTGQRMPFLQAVIGDGGLLGRGAMMRQGVQDAQYIFRDLPQIAINRLTGESFDTHGRDKFGPDIRNRLMGEFDQDKVNAENRAYQDHWRNIVNGLDPRGDIYTALGYATMWPKAAYGTAKSMVKELVNPEEKPAKNFGQSPYIEMDWTTEDVANTNQRWDIENMMDLEQGDPEHMREVAALIGDLKGPDHVR